jgi:DNA-directed RNA polymerase subunit RPC12/RpoP
MSHVPVPKGSLYKCARCGAELGEAVIEVMKKHSQLSDAHFYMVCEKCAGEFED